MIAVEVYVDTLQTTAGCDSVVTLNLTIHNSVNTDTTIIRSCDSAEWRVLIPNKWVVL